jgi:hypothetical protein
VVVADLAAGAVDDSLSAMLPEAAVPSTSEASRMTAVATRFI